MSAGGRIGEALIYAAAVLVLVLIVAAIVGIRLWVAGGDWGCVAAQDIPLCVAVKGAGR